MRFATVFSVLLAGATVQAAMVPPMVRDKEVPWADVQKRQALGTLTWLLGAREVEAQSNFHANSCAGKGGKVEYSVHILRDLLIL